MSMDIAQLDAVLEDLRVTILGEAGGKPHGYLKNAPRNVQQAVFAKANNRLGPNAGQGALERGVDCSPYYQKFRKEQAKHKGFVDPIATGTLRRLKPQGDLGPGIRGSELRKRGKCGEAGGERSKAKEPKSAKESKKKVGRRLKKR